MLYAPFWFMEGGLSGLFETSQRFVEVWRFNGSVHAVVEWAAGGYGDPDAKRAADAVCAGLMVLVLLLSSWRQHDVWRVSATFLLSLLCLTSTVHPWYLLWAAAVMPVAWACLLYTSPSPRDQRGSRMPSSA